MCAIPERGRVIDVVHEVARRRATIREGVTEVNGELVLGSVKAHERRTVAYPESLDEGVAAACSGKGPDDRLWQADNGGFLRPGNSRTPVGLRESLGVA